MTFARQKNLACYLFCVVRGATSLQEQKRCSFDFVGIVFVGGGGGYRGCLLLIVVKGICRKAVSLIKNCFC